jgi:hypothetical protein
MVIEKLNTQELFAALDKTWTEFLELVDSVEEKKINIIPFENSWTAAQLATHVKKSNNAIVQALQMEGKPCNRNADERVEELKNIFLDFTVKFQSPAFIVPEKKEYKKADINNELNTSV